MLEQSSIKKTLLLAFEEDLRPSDITSDAIFNKEEVKFRIVSREKTLLCGVPYVKAAFDERADSISYKCFKEDRTQLEAGDIIFEGHGLARILLPIERTLINILQLSSAIADVTSKCVYELRGCKARLRDTRKTFPGLRDLSKYAASVGGALTYRTCLSDKILIKDNHIVGAGGIKNCIDSVRAYHGEKIYIGIECDTYEQVVTAVNMRANMILLDNMSVAMLEKCVAFVDGRAELEASGGIKMHNIKEIGTTGVDFVSASFITNSCVSRDMAMDFDF